MIPTIADTAARMSAARDTRCVNRSLSSGQARLQLGTLRTLELALGRVPLQFD
jgi:hypothetical protein